ncbi:MAG: CocE/NonD family hydrolase [Gemmatimonadota bacterium]
MRFGRTTTAGITLLASLAATALSAQAPADSVPGFEGRMAMIPTRDGARLHTFIYRPKDHAEALPFIMVRTPYGIAGSPGRQFQGYLKELADEGYIFVFQDIRGRYGSDGQFVMNRPLHDPKDTRGVDESTDTWDTVDWLLKNTAANNGRVGVLGISYPGWLAAMAGVNPHPAVKAISPQAPMTDTWMGDDFFHQGAFRLSYGFEYATSMELSNDGSVPVPIDRYDAYDWYLQLGSLANVSGSVLKGKSVPTWHNFVAHPTYDAFWKARALPTYLTSLTVPTMTVGGWWDQEDFYGALKTYETLEKLDTKGINYLVMGPWNHGGWGRSAGDSLGKISFDDSTGAFFREQAQAPWFAYWLKDKRHLPLPEALLFEAGSNRWRAFDTWPPKTGATAKSLYFRENGRLSFDPPKAPAAFDQYISDPAHPVPYRNRPIQLTYDSRGSDWYTWLTQDQRLADDRPDVLTWQTEPLTEDVTIAGNIIAKLFASTTGRDADWVVKLIDVYPDSGDFAPRMGGYEFMIANDIMRGRYRKSWSHPEPLVPNQVTPFTVDLHQQAYTFLQGHRIMVQVQSSWFPVYDRNPQTWVPNIFAARAADFQAQTHRVYRSARFPSHLEITTVAP